MKIQMTRGGGTITPMNTGELENIKASAGNLHGRCFRIEITNTGTIQLTPCEPERRNFKLE